MSSSSKSDLRVDWATHAAAKYACEHWHYSGCMPSTQQGKPVKIGVWERKKFIRVVVFSRGASPFLLKKYNLSNTEGCELTRVALASHLSPVSRIVSLSIKFLRQQSPGLRLVASFADPSQGHTGVIYQAGNWIYTGTSSSTIEYFVNGKWRHVRDSFYKKNDKTKTRTRPGKHRYLMPLDPEMRAKILPLAQPYPKRPKQATPGTTGEAAGQNRPGRSK
jgi:hypothetical protein